MKNITLIILILFLPLLSFPSWSEIVGQKEYVENEWLIDDHNKKEIRISVNGLITNGDKLIIRLVKDNCENGNLLTYVYTTNDHPDILNLRDTLVDSLFMGDAIIAKILFTSPFLLGHMAVVDLNWIPIEVLKKVLMRENPISMEYIDTDDMKISDYFDITYNSWSNNNLVSTLDKAYEICKKL